MFRSHVRLPENTSGCQKLIQLARTYQLDRNCNHIRWPEIFNRRSENKSAGQKLYQLVRNFISWLKPYQFARKPNGKAETIFDDQKSNQLASNFIRWSETKTDCQIPSKLAGILSDGQTINKLKRLCRLFKNNIRR